MPPFFRSVSVVRNTAPVERFRQPPSSIKGHHLPRRTIRPSRTASFGAGSIFPDDADIPKQPQVLLLTPSVVPDSRLQTSMQVVPIEEEDPETLRKALFTCFDTGRIRRAEEIAEAIKEKDKDIWLIIINGYHKCKQYSLCWKAYDEYKQKETTSDVFFYATMMKVCAAQEKVKKAIELWNEVQAAPDCQPDSLLFNLFLQVCVSARQFDIALQYFTDMKDSAIKRDIVTYNTIISGAARNKGSSTVLRKYMKQLEAELKEEEDLKWDLYTYRAFIRLSLRVNDGKRAIDYLKELFEADLHFHSGMYLSIIEIFITSRLDVDDPHRMFEYCWKLVLRQNSSDQNYAFIHDSLIRLAIRYRQWRIVYGLLKYQSSKNNVVSFRALEAILNAMTLLKGDEREYIINSDIIVQRIREAGVPIGRQTLISLIRICIQAKELDKAMEYLEEMRSHKQRPDLVLYTFLLNAYADRRYAKNWPASRLKVLKLERMTKEDGIKLDVYAYSAILRNLTKNMDVKSVDRVMAEMKEKGVAPTMHSYNAVLHMCSESDDPERFQLAWDLFKEKKESSQLPSNIVTYTIMMSVCDRSNDLEKGLALFEEMKELGVPPNEHAYYTLMHLATGEKKFDLVYDIFEQFSQTEMMINNHIYVALIGAYGKEKKIEKVVELYEDLIQKKIRFDTPFFCCLVTAAGDCNRVDLVYQFFDDFKKRNFRFAYTAYKTMAKILSAAGDSEGARAMEELEKAFVRR